jgi:hypothetical protein
MGKIRKCKLSWQPSDSEEVIGYRLYWSKGDRVSYDSNFFELGKVHEVCLPDVLKLDTRYETSIMLGITAVDIEGNESDMVTLSTPYRTKVPPPPSGLEIITTDESTAMETDIVDRQQSPADPEKPIPQVEPQPAQRRSGPSLAFNSTESRIKYYDDVGYRKLEID